MADIDLVAPSSPTFEDNLQTPRVKHQDHSTLLSHATISRDAAQGTDNYPDFKSQVENPETKSADESDNEGAPRELKLNLENKWNQHLKYAQDYMKKTRTKISKPDMPQNLTNRPDQRSISPDSSFEEDPEMASSRPKERERVSSRKVYDMPPPAHNPRTRVIERELEERPSFDEYRARRRSPSPPSPLINTRSRNSKEPLGAGRTRDRFLNRSGSPFEEFDAPRDAPRGVVPVPRHPERRPAAIDAHVEDFQYRPRRASTYAPLYQESPVPRHHARVEEILEDDEFDIPIYPARPRVEQYARRTRRNGPSANFEPPLSDILENGADYQYSAASTKTSSQHSVVGDSEEELNSAWTPEEVDQPKRRPGDRNASIRASKYRILCRIECDQSRHRENGHLVHHALIYEDVPQWNERFVFSKTSPHLTGRRPIYNLSQYLRSVDRLGFVVYRTYSCHHDSFRQNQRDGAAIMPTVRVQDSEAQDFNETIEIVSHDLEKAIFQVAKCKVECFTGLQDPHLKPDNLKFDSPYLFLYHHRSLLSELSRKGDKPFRLQVLPLLIYLKERQRGLYKEADAMFAKNMTDANLLKFLFCPNEIVVSQKNGIEAAYAIRYLHFHPDDSIQIVGWAWTFDGSSLKRKSEKLHVTFRAGNAKAIPELSAYPLKFASGEVKARLIARGARFLELRTPQLVTYRGMNFLKEKYINEGRCMLDYPTYKIMHRNAEAFQQKTDKSPLDYDNLPESIGKDKELSEEAMILCPPNIHGYLLKEKAWVNLLVDNVYEVTWNKDAFKRLVLPPSTKDLVEALIKAHASANWQQGGLVSGKRLDLIAGKGLGLIMLLHGSPGTGKTLTAESVAEIAEMPLYSVTCGDIGIEVEKVEQYLQTVLYLGKTWNCVLLLDEADVFLEERSLNDLKRNSLVSVFLRTLEYYEGILILTSNRVGTFDEAFRSRIQLALHYPKLTPLFRKKIWQNFFDILSQDKEDVDLIELQSHMDELSEREMNGREIRNALTSARQLASYKQITLQWSHLEETLNIVKVFGDYLRDVHGHVDEDWAREEQLR